MDELRQISSRIRRWREDAHLTLQDLADRSGVSPSTIHKVENNQTIPTLTVFLKIADGLGRDPNDLLAPKSGQHRVSVTRAKDRQTYVGHCGTRIQKVAQNLRNARIEMWRAVLEPGAAEKQCDTEDDGELIFLCEKGQVEMTIDDQILNLSPGDAIHCPAAANRSWRNDGTIPAVITVCMDLPERTVPRNSSRIQHIVSVPEVEFATVRSHSQSNP